jgi:hypothetical protein
MKNVSLLERDWCSSITKKHGHLIEGNRDDRSIISPHRLGKGPTSSLVNELPPQSEPVAC